MNVNRRLNTESTKVEKGLQAAAAALRLSQSWLMALNATRKGMPLQTIIEVQCYHSYDSNRY